MQLFEVVRDEAMRTVKTEMPIRPRAIAICAKCPWVKVNTTSRKDWHNTTNSSLEWFVQRCSSALVKDAGGKLVPNDNYGKPTGTIDGCKEWR